jgi:hypothetical protein
MIDLALDPSETRETRDPELRPKRGVNLRVILFGLAGAGALCGFGVAASTLMAGLAAPAPVTFKVSGKAADWPDLKDGLPALAGSGKVASAPNPAAEPASPALRMAALPEAFTPAAVPARDAGTPPAKVVAAAEPPARRIPVPTPIAPITAGPQAATLPPSRTAALIAPRSSETVKARDVVESAPAPVQKPVAASAPVAAPQAAEKSEKPVRKAVAAQKPPTSPKVAGTAKAPASATVAQAEASEPEETEVLGIKLPSLAPAGRKLKESVDALGAAVKNVF